jgi:peptidoglycan hydrolase-like protein with peptidoglycan-binding domain
MALISPRFRNHLRVQAAARNQPPFKKGETSDGVRALQQALVDLGIALPKSDKGFDCDGIFGSETEAGVRRFQQEHGLTVDGVAGRQTLTAMDRLFLMNDKRYGDPIVDQGRLAAELSGTPGKGRMTCTTARKNPRR